MAASLSRPVQSVVERVSTLDVPDNLEVTVGSYTVPGGTMWLDRIDVNGTFAAEFRFYLNGVFKETKRIETADQPGFQFTSMRVDAGAVLDVRVVHYDVGNMHDYEATFKLHR